MCQIVANRISRTLLRLVPVILVSSLLPYPFGLSAPANLEHFIFFILSITLSVGVMATLVNLMYIFLFYTLNISGLNGIIYGIFMPLAGGIIPLPFFPEPFRSIAMLLPFAALQDIPLRVYNGHIYGVELAQVLGLQVFWLIFLLVTGHLLMKHTLKKVVVQGG